MQHNNNRGQSPQNKGGQRNGRYADRRPPLHFSFNGERVDTLLRHIHRLVRIMTGRWNSGELLNSAPQNLSFEDTLRRDAGLELDMNALKDNLLQALQALVGAGGGEKYLELWFEELSRPAEHGRTLPDTKPPSLPNTDPSDQIIPIQGDDPAEDETETE